METYITICKVDSQWKFAVWLKKLKQGLYINLEEWDGEGDGMEVQKGGDICIPMADSGEGNGNPLQCSCLENPGGGEAWWAAIYGVAQSWTWLKQLSSSSSKADSYWCLTENNKILWSNYPSIKNK